MPPNNFTFFTQHLKFRPVSLTDLEALHRLWNNDKVRRYLWDEAPHIEPQPTADDKRQIRSNESETIDKEQCKAIVNDSKRMFRNAGLGLWGVRLLNSKPLIGFGGFWQFPEPPELQILYGLHPDYWRQGLATEIAKAVIQFGFMRNKLTSVSGSNAALNIASSRVLQKAGMVFDFQTKKNSMTTVYYKITKTHWQPDGCLEFKFDT